VAEKQKPHDAVEKFDSYGTEIYSGIARSSLRQHGSCFLLITYLLTYLLTTTEFWYCLNLPEPVRKPKSIRTFIAKTLYTVSQNRHHAFVHIDRKILKTRVPLFWNTLYISDNDQ